MAYSKDFKIEIGTNFKDCKRDITIIDRKYEKRRHGKSIVNEKLYKYKCNKCGFNCGKHWSNKNKCYKDELWIEESNLINNKVGCSCCNKGNQIVVKGINDIATTNPELIDIFVNINDCYTHIKSSHDYCDFICKSCGNIKRTRIDYVYSSGFSCSKCGDGISYPNKFMYNLLEQLNIEFETEYCPQWIKPKRYDFYIPSMNLIIEMDGGFHKKYNPLSGQTAEQSKEIDNYKDKLAKGHGLKVIRIDANYDNFEFRFDLIKNNIIKSKLNEIFDLDNIDWGKINETSLKSKVKDISEYWYIHNNINNENLTTSDLSKIFHMDRHTVCRYLKQGNSLNWCNYDSKLTSYVTKVNNCITSSSIKIKILKNNKILGEFDSITDLSRKSKELFGVYLERHKISKCKKYNLCYNGFYFK